MRVTAASASSTRRTSPGVRAPVSVIAAIRDLAPTRRLSSRIHSVPSAWMPKPPIWISGQDRHPAQAAPVGGRIHDVQTGDAGRRRRREQRDRQGCALGLVGRAHPGQLEQQRADRDEDQEGQRDAAGRGPALQSRLAGAGTCQDLGLRTQRRQVGGLLAELMRAQTAAVPGACVGAARCAGRRPGHGAQAMQPSPPARAGAAAGDRQPDVPMPHAGVLGATVEACFPGSPSSPIQN